MLRSHHRLAVWSSWAESRMIIRSKTIRRLLLMKSMLLAALEDVPRSHVGRLMDKVSILKHCFKLCRNLELPNEKVRGDSTRTTKVCTHSPEALLILKNGKDCTIGQESLVFCRVRTL